MLVHAGRQIEISSAFGRILVPAKTTEEDVMLLMGGTTVLDAGEVEWTDDIGFITRFQLKNQFVGLEKWILERMIPLPKEHPSKAMLWLDVVSPVTRSWLRFYFVRTDVVVSPDEFTEERFVYSYTDPGTGLETLQIFVVETK